MNQNPSTADPYQVTPNSPSCPKRRAARTARGALSAGVFALMAPAWALGASGNETVLVKLDPGATAAERAEITNDLDATRSRGGLLGGWRAYDLSDPMSMTEVRRALASADGALAVSADVPLKALSTTNDPLQSFAWGVDFIRAPQAWAAYPSPSLVTVAVIDTGVQVDHPDLAASMWKNPGEISGNGLDDDHNGYVDDVDGWDFAANDASVYDNPVDDLHGTHVSGIIAAVPNNGIGIAGVAPNARVMPLKFLAGDSGGTTEDALRAMRYARDNGAKVVNASWGVWSPDGNAPLCDGVDDLSERGIYFVSAAGNSNMNNDIPAKATLPAACPAALNISVAWTTQLGNKAGWSNYSGYTDLDQDPDLPPGSYWAGVRNTDIAAPGSDILSTAPRGTYETLSGTSMAAPHVSGALAYLLGARPGMDPARVRNVLITSSPVAIGGVVGMRVLDLPSALTAASSPLRASWGLWRKPLLRGRQTVFKAGDPVAWEEAEDARYNPEPVFTPSVGVRRYYVIQDGVEVAQTPGHVLRWFRQAPIADGSHTLQIIAEDYHGGRVSSPVVPVTIDATKPAPFSVSAKATPGGRLDISWSASSDQGTGLSLYRVFDGNAWSEFSTLAERSRTSLLELGTHTWAVQAVDVAGNVRTVSGESTLLPLPPEQPKITSPTVGGTWWNIPSVEFELHSMSLNLPVESARVEIDGTPVATLDPSQTRFTPEALSFGRHSVRVVAVNAGGETSSAPVGFDYLDSKSSTGASGPAALSPAPASGLRPAVKKGTPSTDPNAPQAPILSRTAKWSAADERSVTLRVKARVKPWRLVALVYRDEVRIGRVEVRVPARATRVNVRMPLASRAGGVSLVAFCPGPAAPRVTIQVPKKGK